MSNAVAVEVMGHLVGKESAELFHLKFLEAVPSNDDSSIGFAQTKQLRGGVGADAGKHDQTWWNQPSLRSEIIDNPIGKRVRRALPLVP